jgi:hypothetical protein
LPGKGTYVGRPVSGIQLNVYRIEGSALLLSTWRPFQKKTATQRIAVFFDYEKSYFEAGLEACFLSSSAAISALISSASS